MAGVGPTGAYETYPLRRSCVSKRSRCGAVRICLERGEPSAEIVRVEALSLWRRANLSWSRRTLCGDRACRSALAVAPCEFVLSAANPLRRSCVSKRSRCGAARICLDLGEPSAEILRVEALSLWRRANLSWSRRALCGDRECRIALAVAPCASVLSPMNPLRRSCVSKRSRCGAVRFSCSRNGFWKLSRGVRACFRNPAVSGSIPPWSAAAPA